MANGTPALSLTDDFRLCLSAVAPKQMTFPHPRPPGFPLHQLPASSTILAPVLLSLQKSGSFVLPKVTPQSMPLFIHQLLLLWTPPHTCPPTPAGLPSLVFASFTQLAALQPTLSSPSSLPRLPSLPLTRVLVPSCL